MDLTCDVLRREAGGKKVGIRLVSPRVVRPAPLVDSGVYGLSIVPRNLTEVACDLNLSRGVLTCASRTLSERIEASIREETPLAEPARDFVKTGWPSIKDMSDGAYDTLRERS